MGATVTLGDAPLVVSSPRRSPWRRRAFAGGTVVVAAAVAVVIVIDPFSGSPSAANDGATTSTTSLAEVTRQTLTSQTLVDGTLGYAGSFTVASTAAGTVTQLPAVGAVVRQGHPLYAVDGAPVALLIGSTPAYRALASGDQGADVQQLNHDLVALGYVTASELDPASDRYGYWTRIGVEKLQKALGVEQTGSLAAGSFVFAPSETRVTALTATLGGSIQPGAPVLSATSTRRLVSVSLDASQQGQIHTGQHVAITLPDQQTTAGVVSKVGSVATAPSDSDKPTGSSTQATITVEITPTDPRATGVLDSAPVQVAITTATAKDALVVPVTALLALAGGGYAVEAVDSAGVHSLVAVTTGLFDDAQGLVQVDGNLSPGTRVVVPGQ